MDEIWKQVLGYKYYEVSNKGNTRSWKGRGQNGGLLKEPTTKKTFVGADGYVFVKLQQGGKRTNYRVHRLVLEAFVGKRPQGMQARHLDGNKLHNTIDNLVWGTSKENHADKERHGTSNKGERHGHNSVLTKEDVREIRRLIFSKKYTLKAIGKLFGVSVGAISRIKYGGTWSWLK
jgi:hypothetical protein